MALDRIEISELQDMEVTEFEALLDGIEQTGRAMVLEEAGVSKFVLVPYEWWRRMVPGRYVDKDEADRVRED